MRVLIIVPAFNEEGNIETVITNIRKVSSDFDILIINDCSTDRTEYIAKSLEVNIISLPINLGIGGAVQTGFKYAYENNYDIAIQVDGDGQHNPRYITTLLDPLSNKSADVVNGSRFIDKKGFQSNFFRRLGIRFFQLLVNILVKCNITDSTSGFRAYNAKAIELLKDNYPTDFPEPEAIIFLKKRQFRIIEVPVQMESRGAGISSISAFKSIYYMIKVSISIIVEFLRSNNG